LAPPPYPEVEVTAIAGNGRLLAGFDAAGSLRTLTGPHLDFPQHIRSSRIGLAAPAKRSTVQWLSGPGWRHQQDYLEGTNILRTRSTRASMEVEQRAAAVGEALLIGLRIRGKGPMALAWELGLQVGGQPLANTLEYFPRQDALLAYFREHAVALAAMPTAERVEGVARGAGGHGASHAGGKRFAAVGMVEARVRISLPAGEVALLLIAVGSPTDAMSRLQQLRERLKTADGWPIELALPPLSGAARSADVARVADIKQVQPAARELYARSVLTIAQMTDRSGALLAGPPIDAAYQRSGGYGFCWPRDGAFIANALDTVGERGASRAYFEWALGIQPEDGIWKQRYFADGTVGPCWAAHQLDETGTMLWALDQHLRMAFDSGLLKRGLQSALRAYRSISQLAAESGWPPVSQNLWEDQDASHLYTLAALLAGARAWHQRARSMQESEAVLMLSRVEDQLRQALATWPVDRKTGALARALISGDRAPRADFTSDASLLAMSVPFDVLPADDPRMRATVALMEKTLRSSSGRMRRYQGDLYRGGNPWPLFGLWLAWYHLRAGNRQEALRLYKQAITDRTPAGLLSEQVDARTGAARWVVPLPWAHAWFLLVTHALMPPAAAPDRDFFFTGVPVQDVRRARALSGGLFHSGLPSRASAETAANPTVQAVLRPGLSATEVVAEIAGGPIVPLKPAGSDNGSPGAVWTGKLPAAPAGSLVRYRIRADLKGDERGSVWAADADPRPEGQEFVYEAAPPPPPDWVADAIGYHLMVDRFGRPGQADWPAVRSVTDLYGGTLEGVKERLDHIQSLSANLLWLSPVFASPSHHGYDQTDHFQVEPRYGGNQALKTLVEAAHKRGIKVILDYVPNHTGRGHSLFLRALQEDADAAAWYRFWQWPHYYRSFFDHIVLPEMDTSRRQVQEYLVGVARRWVEEFDIDGLRCDHVPGVDPAFWVELRRAMRALKPDFFLLAEAVGTDDEMAAYTGRMDGVIDFVLARLLRMAFAESKLSPKEFVAALDEHEQAFPRLARATFLDNHDMNRFLWLAGGDKARLRLGATALMTLPGMPIIYYGTEVGISQTADGLEENAAARLPMSWGKQDKDLLQHFVQLGRLRRQSAALRRGARRTVLADQAVLAYERTIKNERLIVVLNFSSETQHRRLKGAAAQSKERLSDQMNVATVAVDGSDLSVELPPLGGAVIGPQPAGGR
jgi:glycosidase/tetratricopeptide (TPR) repeat protein